MSVRKDPKQGTWTVQCWYHDWKGERRKKTKRGFDTKSAARKWEQDFISCCEGTPTMTLEEFFKLYERDVRPRVKQSTWDTKEHMVRTKILPYLGKRPVNEITSADVIQWQNELMAGRTSTGEPYAPTYLHTLSNQLSALLNHAVTHYNLPSNPARKVGKMGSKSAGEMGVWTKDQYLSFSRAIMDKPDSWMAFELLYWTGIREGELLALTPEDIDLEAGTLRISKTYSRRRGEDVVTPPKTPKSNRRVVLPDFLTDELRDYLSLPGTCERGGRIFRMTKSRLYHEMERGCAIAGVPRIRVHDLRHSHVSLLIDMGYSALAIAERMGHETTEVTMRYAHLFPNKQEEMARGLDVEGRCKR